MKITRILITLTFLVVPIHAQHQPLQLKRQPENTVRAYSPATTPTSRSSDDTITLARTACFGTCPIYTVTINSDGTVSFQAQRFTKVQSATGKISRKAFRKLVREFEKIKYFSLPDDFLPGTKVCPQMVTDMPSAITSIRLKGKSKTVSHYHGCGNSGVLAQLSALENKIDEIAGTQKWIK